MQIYFSLLVCIVGGVAFLLTTGDAKALAKDMFWCGLLAFLLNGVPHLGVIGK